MGSETRVSEEEETLRDIEASLDLQELTDQLRENVEIADRRYRFKTYKRCFVGSEASDWLVESGIASDYEQAIFIGNVMLNAGIFHHVVREHEFANDYLFYRFADDEDHGKHRRDEGGHILSWAKFAQPSWDLDGERESLLPEIPDYHDELLSESTVDDIGIEPLDEHNVHLLDKVHPAAWINPEPKERYNVVVLGAGTGGLVTAAAAAGLGARVALVEAHLMGGDCLNVGCVPSKALLRSARAAAEVRRAAQYGVKIEGIDDIGAAVRVDFGAVMERLRAQRAHIAHVDSAERFSRELGIDVFIGRGTFTGRDTLEVDGKTLHFAKACVATGGTPALPPIEGLAEAPYLTNANLFNLTELPERFGVLGAGVIGVEMAQAFQRLGAQVTMFERGERVLPREDPDAAAVVQASLQRDGVDIRFGSQIVRVELDDRGGPRPVHILHLDDGDTIEVDALLVATGRRPNVEGIGLEAAGVRFDGRRGVEVNDRLQTSNPHIYAVGDVATRYQFTHAADFMARIVVRNALFFGRDKFSNLLIPWCTYTQPEIAHVGLYPRDLEERGIEYKTFTRYFDDVDRAIVDGETEGFVRMHVRKGSDEILGATIVGEHAGDMISEVTLAMQSKTGLGKLASVIHPYPTKAEAVRQLGDLYNRTRLTLTVKKIFRQLMSLKR